MLWKQRAHKTGKKNLTNNTVPIEKSQAYYIELEKEYGKHKNPFSELTDEPWGQHKNVWSMEKKTKLTSLEYHTPLVAYLKTKFSPYLN